MIEIFMIMRYIVKRDGQNLCVKCDWSKKFSVKCDWDPTITNSLNFSIGKSVINIKPHSWKHIRPIWDKFAQYQTRHYYGSFDISNLSQTSLISLLCVWFNIRILDHGWTYMTLINQLFSSLILTLNSYTGTFLYQKSMK